MNWEGLERVLALGWAVYTQTLHELFILKVNLQVYIF